MKIDEMVLEEDVKWARRETLNFLEGVGKRCIIDDGPQRVGVLTMLSVILICEVTCSVMRKNKNHNAADAWLEVLIETLAEMVQDGTKYQFIERE